MSLQLVGRLSDQYAGSADFREAHHAALVPALTALLACPRWAAVDRVRGHACAAITTFAHPETCPAECLEPHLEV